MLPRYKLYSTQTFSGHKSGIYCLQPSVRQGYLLSCGSDGYIAEWNVATGEGRTLLQCPGAIFSLWVDAQRGLLAAGTQAGILYFADLKTNTVLKAFEAHTRGIFDLLLLPGNLLAATGGDGFITLWNPDTLELQTRRSVSGESIRTLISWHASTLLAGSSDGWIRQLTPELEIMYAWEAHRFSVFRLLTVPGEHQLFSAGRDAHINVWDQTFRNVDSLPAHLYAINDLVPHPTLPLLFSGSMDKTIKIWNQSPLTLLRVADPARNGVHRNGVNRLLWMGERLYSCSDDRTIMEWELREE